MASKTQISNMALVRVGADRIIATGPGTTESELCELFFDFCRDCVLEDAEWTFATERHVLDSPNPSEPEWGYSKKFKLPPNTLRVVEVQPNDDWAVESGYILSNSSSLRIRTVRKVSNPESFSPGFTAAMVSRLAMEICLPLTSSSKLYKEIQAEYFVSLRSAKSNDGRQSVPRQKTMSGRWRR